MSRLVWEPAPLEVGVSHGVVYFQDQLPEVWNGLLSVEEDEDGYDQETRYLDGVGYRKKRTKGTFAGKIEAFSAPISLIENLAVLRNIPAFNFSYRVGSKIHLVYNLLLQATESNFEQTNALVYSWGFSTKPVAFPEIPRMSHMVIDTSIAYPQTVSDFEETLYGAEGMFPRFPTPAEVLEIFEVNSILRVYDNGDGSFTVEGPDEAIVMLDPTTFEITWPSAIYIDSETYTIRSL